MESMSRAFQAPTTTRLNIQLMTTTAISVLVNQMKNTLTPDKNNEAAEIIVYVFTNKTKAMEKYAAYDGEYNHCILLYGVYGT